MPVRCRGPSTLPCSWSNRSMIPGRTGAAMLGTIVAPGEATRVRSSGNPAGDLGPKGPVTIDGDTARMPSAHDHGRRLSGPRHHGVATIATGKNRGAQVKNSRCVHLVTHGHRGALERVSRLIHRIWACETSGRTRQWRAGADPELACSNGDPRCWALIDPGAHGARHRVATHAGAASPCKGSHCKQTGWSHAIGSPACRMRAARGVVGVVHAAPTNGRSGGQRQRRRCRHRPPRSPGGVLA